MCKLTAKKHKYKNKFFWNITQIFLSAFLFPVIICDFILIGLLTVFQLKRRWRRKGEKRTLLYTLLQELYTIFFHFCLEHYEVFFPRREFSDLFSPYSLTPLTFGPRDSVSISRDIIINNEVAKVTSSFSNGRHSIFAAYTKTI